MNEGYFQGEWKKVLASLADKDRRFKKLEERFAPMTERERQIMGCGWAECETHVGLERYAESQDEVEKKC